MILILAFGAFALIFLRQMARETEEVKKMTMKLRLSMHRLATETPRSTEEQANSIIGLEADVCAIRGALKEIKEDIRKIKEATDA